MATRVLVADDNEDHRFLTTRALRDIDARVQVDTANDGEEALDAVLGRGRHAGQPLPHLVLLDIRMPRLDGLEVLERMKTDERLRTIPVVMLTSSDREEDVDRSYRLGANCYVTKPATGAGLREGLRQVAEFWAARASLPEPA